MKYVTLQYDFKLIFQIKVDNQYYSSSENSKTDMNNIGQFQEGFIKNTNNKNGTIACQIL